MFRSLAVSFVVGILVLGCVSIAPAATSAPPTALPTSASPTAVPTSSQTMTPAVATPAVTPSAAPADTPADTPTVTPTNGPTESPQSPASPVPSPAGVENYGAATPLINDSFDDEASGWGVGTNGGGSVAYGDSTLDLDTASAGAWEYSTRLAGSTSNAMHLETVYTPSGDGYTGLLCAERDDQLWGAAANADGKYFSMKLDANGPTVLSQGQLDILRTPEFAMSSLALDCAGTATGSFRMQVYSPGINIGVQYFAPVDEGPRSFDRVGLYAESTADPYSVSVDYMLAFGGTGDTSPSPAETELMTHVPGDWLPKCFPAFASFFAVGATADIFCRLDGGRSDYAEYTSFDTKTNMDGYFDYLVGKWGVPEQGQNCDTGPHQGTYSIGNKPAGRILCAPAITGTRVDWTYDKLLILSELIDLEGSYPDMYQDWLIAGPN